MNKQTAREYHFRLANFKKFVSLQYNNNITIDKLIENINNQQIPNGEYVPYEILSNYCIYLQDNGLNTTTLKQRVVTAKNFLERLNCWRYTADTIKGQQISPSYSVDN